MKISVIFGTRPEAIKLAPVILALRKHPDIECHVCVTAQHREMLDQVLTVFDIIPDTDLNIMSPNQTLSQLTASALPAVDNYLANETPDLVLVQGDTTTAFDSSLAAFYFAPTELIRQNLLAESVPSCKIFITGNTVIDALFLAVQKVKNSPPPVLGLDSSIMADRGDSPLVLIIVHRRENFGRGFESICQRSE